MMSSGPTKSRPPAEATTAVFPFGYEYCQVPPETVPITMAMGMIVRMRNAVVTRLRSRSG